MKNIKFICPKCNHAEKKKWQDMVREWILGALTAAGILYIIMCFCLGWDGMSYMLINSITSEGLYYYASHNSEDLRETALNYTTYSGDDSFMFAMDLLTNMPKIRYVPTNKFDINIDPEETLKYGGDCKSDSVLFASMMLSAGYEARTDCNLEHKHCVVIVPHKTSTINYNNYMIVDLTIDRVRVYNNTINHWKQPHLFETQREFDKNVSRT